MEVGELVSLEGLEMIEHGKTKVEVVLSCLGGIYALVLLLLLLLCFLLLHEGDLVSQQFGYVGGLWIVFSSF